MSLLYAVDRNACIPTFIITDVELAYIIPSCVSKIEDQSLRNEI